MPPERRAPHVQIVDLDLAQQVLGVVVAVHAELRQRQRPQRLDPRQIQIAEQQHRLGAHLLGHQRRVHRRAFVGEGEHAHGRRPTLVSARNVLGGELEPCGTDPMTGCVRDGCCTERAETSELHILCVT